jgi:hypothetical protein
MNAAFGQLRVETLPGIWELGFGTSETGVEGSKRRGIEALTGNVVAL